MNSLEAELRLAGLPRLESLPIILLWLPTFPCGGLLTGLLNLSQFDVPMRVQTEVLRLIFRLKVAIG